MVGGTDRFCAELIEIHRVEVIVKQNRRYIWFYISCQKTLSSNKKTNDGKMGLQNFIVYDLVKKHYYATALIFRSMFKRLLQIETGK